MADGLVEELLKRWGVPQLLDRCIEQEVDFDALRSFSEDVITELVPMIGPRCKFLRGWRTWSEAGFPTPSASPAPPPTPGALGQPAPRANNPVPARPQLERAPFTPAVKLSLGVAELGADQSQAGPSSVDAKKEVSVFLEGKITYDDGDSSSGWLAANGFISTSTTRGSAFLNQGSIKTELIDDEVPSEADVGRGDAVSSDPRKGPRFQLEGRISLSVQEFVEVPSFMFASSAPAPLQHQGDDSFGPHHYGPDSPGVFASPAQDALPSAHCSATSSAPRAKRSREEKLDLEALLNASSKGKMILSLYQQKGALDGPSRQTLTDLIIAEELREDFNRRITSQRFQEIAETIVALFPGENEDTYFANDRSYGERPGGKGKLTSKYYNTRRQLAKSGVISRGFNKERKQIIQQGTLASLQYLSAEESQAAHQNMKWVQSLGWQMDLSPEDLGEALDKWRGCWKLRMLRILSPQHQPDAYIDDFRLLRMPYGESLISSDFDMLFKNTGDRFITEWPQFSSMVISMLSEDYRKQIPLLDLVRRTVTTSEGMQVGALLLLTSMLPVTTCRGSGENGELWRPTRQEAQDGFLLHVEREEEVAQALERHWGRMQLMGQPLGPLPVVVGQSLDQLQKAFVAIDATTAYYVPNGIRAVDLCFKCFHALQVPYPPQAANAWLFVQHALYQVATPADRMSVSVSSLLADFGYRPVPPVVSWDQVLGPPSYSAPKLGSLAELGGASGVARLPPTEGGTRAGQ